MSDKEKRSQILRVYDVLDCIHKIQSYLAGKDKDSFLQDKMAQDAVVRNIEIIGEAAKQISGDICAAYPGIPWRDMKAIRDVIAHGYFDVNVEVVWVVATEEIPPLEDLFKKLYADLEAKV